MKRIILLLAVGVLAACGDNRAEQLDLYIESMSEVESAHHAFNNAVNDLSLNDLESFIEMSEIDDQLEYLSGLTESIDEELYPHLNNMKRELDLVFVATNELEELHSTYIESYETKVNFTEQLEEYIDLYYNSILTNEELIRLSQLFIENQEIRRQYIDNVENEREANEIDELVERINENSAELEEKSIELQNEPTLLDKQNYIDNTLSPLINSHIRNLNEMNLDTDLAIRVRSITLEMYFGYEKYYTERRDTIFYNEELQNMQFSSIIGLIDVYENLDETYYEEREELEDELS